MPAHVQRLVKRQPGCVLCSDCSMAAVQDHWCHLWRHWYFTPVRLRLHLPVWPAQPGRRCGEAIAGCTTSYAVIAWFAIRLWDARALTGACACRDCAASSYGRSSSLSSSSEHTCRPACRPSLVCRDIAHAEAKRPPCCRYITVVLCADDKGEGTAHSTWQDWCGAADTHAEEGGVLLAQVARLRCSRSSPGTATSPRPTCTW